ARTPSARVRGSGLARDFSAGCPRTRVVRSSPPPADPPAHGGPLAARDRATLHAGFHAVPVPLAPPRAQRCARRARWIAPGHLSAGGLGSARGVLGASALARPSTRERVRAPGASVLDRGGCLGPPESARAEGRRSAPRRGRGAGVREGAQAWPKRDAHLF